MARACPGKPSYKFEQRAICNAFIPNEPCFLSLMPFFFFSFLQKIHLHQAPSQRLPFPPAQVHCAPVVSLLPPTRLLGRAKKKSVRWPAYLFSFAHPLPALAGIRHTISIFQKFDHPSLQVGFRTCLPTSFPFFIFISIYTYFSLPTTEKLPTIPHPTPDTRNLKPYPRTPGPPNVHTLLVCLPDVP